MNYINLIASICSIIGLIITIINIIITGSIKRSIINRKSRKDYEKIKKDILPKLIEIRDKKDAQKDSRELNSSLIEITTQLSHYELHMHKRTKDALHNVIIALTTNASVDGRILDSFWGTRDTVPHATSKDLSLVNTLSCLIGELKIKDITLDD